MSKKVLGFIGAGNMAGSLIAGLLADAWPADNIWAADVDERQTTRLGQHFGIHTTTDNPAVVAEADVLVLAVKPQSMQQVARGIAAQVQARRPLVISVAAGISLDALDDWLGGGIAVVRTMPNTPALVRSGATALLANNQTTLDQRNQAEAILRSVGLTVWVEAEILLDTVTALSGSGPAYFFLLMEAMEQAAVNMGLDRETARLLTQQTALGAAKVAIESDETPAELRRRVTSPGGTTERAIAVFENKALLSTVLEAMQAASQRSDELSKLLRN
jgi:pyrroline-5-carboxylate reductase